MSQVSTAFWRKAGLNFLQYLNVSARATRGALKEPARSQAQARDVVYFNKTVGDLKTPVSTSIPK